MALTDVQIINLGLAKIGSSRIRRINPPQTSLEKFISEAYLHWKQSELSKRRWVFATEHEFSFSQVEELTETARPFKYQVPADCVRLIRYPSTEWIQRGQFIYSAYEALKGDYIRLADESEFDAWFNETLATRVALECVEYVTQSNTKKETVERWYARSIADAGKANAYVIGTEDLDQVDEHFEFLAGRE